MGPSAKGRLASARPRPPTRGPENEPPTKVTEMAGDADEEGTNGRNLKKRSETKRERTPMNHLGNTGEDGEQDNGAVSEESESDPNVTAEEYRTRGLPAEPIPGIAESVTSGLTKKDSLILVVDDQIDNVALLSFDLQQKGYRVVTATNGVEAVKVALLMKPNLILMDISMPELDGLAATSKIREDESLRTVPVIAVTAFTTAGFRRAAYDVGFDGYITKPIELQQLHELIVRLLSQTQDRDPHSSGGMINSDTGRR